MTGEAQVLDNRRNAENPPRRHRDHRDDPGFVGGRGSDVILRALCVSVVPNPQASEGHASSTQLCETKPICSGGRKVGTACPAKQPGSLRAKQSQSAGVQMNGN
jgi:hypothetical protein